MGTLGRANLRLVIATGLSLCGGLISFFASAVAAQQTGDDEKLHSVLNIPASELRMFVTIPVNIGIDEVYVETALRGETGWHPLSGSFYLEALELTALDDSRVEIEFGMLSGYRRDYDSILSAIRSDQSPAGTGNRHWGPKVLFCPRPGKERLSEFEFELEVGDGENRFDFLEGHVAKPYLMALPSNVTLCNF